MKKYIAPLLGIALVVTACTDRNQAAPAETTVQTTPEPATASSAPASPLGATLAPAPSETPTAAVLPTTTPLAPQPTTAPASTQAPPSPPAPGGNTQTSARGHLIKQVGELAGIRDEGGEYLATFTVNDIIVDVPCTDELADPPQNGHFVALDVSVETSPNMLNSDLIQQFSMSSLTFQAIDPDGVTSNAGTDSWATLFCLDDSVQPPGNIGPGEKANGLMLLDVENPKGILIYEDFWTDNAWEYAY